MHGIRRDSLNSNFCIGSRKQSCKKHHVSRAKTPPVSKARFPVDFLCLSSGTSMNRSRRTRPYNNKLQVSRPSTVMLEALCDLYLVRLQVKVEFLFIHYLAHPHLFKRLKFFLCCHGNLFFDQNVLRLCRHSHRPPLLHCALKHHPFNAGKTGSSHSTPFSRVVRFHPSGFLWARYLFSCHCTDWTPLS